MPKVSIIMPTFNSEQYVEESVLSVARQTESDIEILIMDDGSTDGTLPLLRRLASADSRIHVHSGPHTGYPGAPRNRGLALAEGDYIGFLDSDDLYHPEKIKTVVSILDSFPEVDLVFHDFAVFEQDPSRGISYLKGFDFLHAAAEHLVEVEPQTYLCDRGLYSFMSVQVAPFHMSSVIFRRQVLGSGTFRLREDIRVGDDGDLWLRLGMCCRAAFRDEILSFYRKRQDSISADSIDYLEGAIEIHLANLQRGKHILSAKEEKLYREKIAGQCFDVGYQYFSMNDRQRARAAYRQSLRMKLALRTLAAYLKTCAPVLLARAFRGATHSSNVPGGNLEQDSTE